MATDDEDKQLYCDLCDKTMHLYCLDPPLNAVPKGRWLCSACGQCEACKSSENLSNITVPRESGGLDVFVATYCLDCKAKWERSEYCPCCLRIGREEHSMPCQKCERFY